MGLAQLALIVTVFLLFSASTASASGEPISAWLTTGDRGKLLEPQSSFNFGGDKTDGLVIDVNENHLYQPMEGFGAAMTDSSSWLISSKLSASQRAELMSRLFSPSAGIGLNYLRIPIGASDFSLSHYTYDDTCCDLADFSVGPDEAHRVPVLVQAKGVNPALKLMGSPWTRRRG